jgi:hypothetical protein
VLTDYTEEALLAIDPKLVVLAPFTLSSKTDKSTLLIKGQEWSESVTQVFPAEQEQEALNILGLFVLNRFRKMSEKEVMAMLHFDLMDTVAGRQLSERSYQKGIHEDARKMVVKALQERFGIVPGDIIDQIRAISHHDVLESLFVQAMRCLDMDSFKKMLSKATK